MRRNGKRNRQCRGQQERCNCASELQMASLI
jgi:hypothetical protein